MKKHEETTLSGYDATMVALFSYDAVMYALLEIDALERMGVKAGYKPTQDSLKIILEQGMRIVFVASSLERMTLRSKLLGELRDEIVRLAEYVHRVIEMEKEVLIGDTYIRTILDTVCNDLDKVTTGTVNIVKKVELLRKLNDYMDKEKVELLRKLNDYMDKEKPKDW